MLVQKVVRLKSLVPSIESVNKFCGWTSVKTSLRRFSSNGSDSVKLKQIKKDVFMPTLALGTWKAEPNKVGEAVKYALKCGYRHFDCAAVYKNEREIGEALQEGMKELGLKRKDIFITSKLWNTEHHPENITHACHQTIHDLRTDYVDCYLMHWPVAFVRGNGTHPKNPDGTAQYEDIPLWETWEAMQKLLDEGIVKSLGVSNFTISHIEELINDSDVKPDVLQVELHPYLRQPKLVQYCKDKDIALMAYSPLAQGKQLGSSMPVLLEDPTIVKIASKYGKSAAQIILRWGVQSGFVVLPKSVTPANILSNSQIYDFSLKEEDMKEIDALNRDLRTLQPSWASFEEK